jgi:putative ABC transport system ATP-binding protein
MMNLLQQLNSDGMTIIMVTHNPECARYARRILRLSDGLLAEEEKII